MASCSVARKSNLKLVIIIANASDADRLVNRLVEKGLPATKIASSGGFLRRGNTTILSGVEDNDVELVLSLSREECRSRMEFVPVHSVPILGETSTATEPIEVRVGGATVFVIPIDHFERF